MNELEQTIKRIVTNLAYLMGELLAKLGGSWEWIKEAMTSFIEGYNDGNLAHIQ